MTDITPLKPFDLDTVVCFYIYQDLRKANRI